VIKHQDDKKQCHNAEQQKKPLNSCYLPE